MSYHKKISIGLIAGMVMTLVGTSVLFMFGVGESLAVGTTPSVTSATFSTNGDWGDLDRIVLRFNMPVFANANGTGNLGCDDFTFTDGNSAGLQTYAGATCTHTAGNDWVVIEFATGGAVVGDIADTITPVAGAVFTVGGALPNKAINLALDTTAPTFTAKYKQGDDKVLLTYDEPTFLCFVITGTFSDTPINGSEALEWVDGSGGGTTGISSFFAAGNRRHVIVDLTTDLITGDVTGGDGVADAIRVGMDQRACDAFGHGMGMMANSITLGGAGSTSDATAPEITSVEGVKEGTRVLVNFSEPVFTDATMATLDNANINNDLTYTDVAGTKTMAMIPTPTHVAGNDWIMVALDGAITVGDLASDTFAAASGSAIVDAFANNMGTTPVTINDTTSPTIISITDWWAAGPKVQVIVTYSEDVTISGGPAAGGSQVSSSTVGDMESTACSITGLGAFASGNLKYKAGRNTVGLEEESVGRSFTVDMSGETGGYRSSTDTPSVCSGIFTPTEDVVDLAPTPNTMSAAATHAAPNFMYTWDTSNPFNAPVPGGTPGSTSIALTWTEVTGGSGAEFGEYKFFYGTTAGAGANFGGTEWGEINDAALGTLTTTGTTITGLTGGMTYYITPYSVDSYGNATAGTEISVATTTPAPLLTGAAYQDADGNGRVDKIKLTFDQTINTCTATVEDFTYTAGSITNSALSGGTVTCLGTDEYVYINLVSVGGSNITSHSTAPTLAYTDYASREISNTVNGQVATFGVQDVTDGAGPVVVSASTGDYNNNGTTDLVTFTYSEALSNTGPGLNGFDVSSASNHGSSCNSEYADPNGTTTLVLSFTCTGAYTAVGDMSIAFTANSGVKDAANNQSPTVTLTNSSTPAITDGAQPVLISATKGTASNQNKLTLVYSEPMYLELTGTAGTIDSGDITSTESMTSTSGVGGISAAGTIRQIGTFGTAGTVTQSAETNNTVAVSSDGLTVTVTLNTADGAYFTNSVTPPSGTFTPTDTVTAPCVLAQTPNATTSTQRVNSSATAPTSSGSWDLTAPDQITGFTPGTTGATFIPMTWSPITAPSDFASFKLYYSGFTGVTYTSSNGTLLVDSTLSTGSTSQATISGLATGARYYFVIYAIDTAGNLSAASSEATDVASVKNIGGGGGAAAATAVTIPPVVDTVPPSAPSGQNAEYKDGKILLTWTDPRNSDFADIEICKKGTTDTCVIVSRGMQNYTDTNFNIGDTVKYILKAKDITGNKSTNTEELTIVARQAHVVTAEEKNLIEEEIALLEKSISMMDKVVVAANARIDVLKKSNNNKKITTKAKNKNLQEIAQFKSLVRRIEKNQKNNVLPKLAALKKRLEG